MVSYPGVDKDIQLATLQRELYAHNKNNTKMGKTKRKRKTKRRKRFEAQV